MADALTIERHGTGHRVRLRYGKGNRERFFVPIADAKAARLRAGRLSVLAKSLTRAGVPSIQIKVYLEEAASATDAVLSRIEETAQSQLRKMGKEPRERRKTATFRQLAEEWTSGELHRRWPDYVKLKRSSDTDEGRVARLCETIGSVPLEGFTLEDAERAMAALPANLSPTTRRAYAQLISRVLKLAVCPCKLIQASPLPPEFMPARGKQKAHTYLYPDEDAQLLACVEVPIERRMLYGFLAREGMRLSEAKGLEWSDVDLKRGVVRLDKNKTSDPRVWALNPGVTEALKLWRARGNGGSTVFNGLPFDHSADVFRKDLKTAKVNRSELFEVSKNRSPIRVHDLRATFVTLALAAGRTEAWVTDRTGHRSSQMIVN